MEATLLAYIHPSFIIDKLSLVVQAFHSSSIYVLRLLHRDPTALIGRSTVCHPCSLESSCRSAISTSSLIISIVKHHSSFNIIINTTAFSSVFLLLIICFCFCLSQEFIGRVPGLGTGHGMFYVDQRDTKNMFIIIQFVLFFLRRAGKGVFGGI